MGKAEFVGLGAKDAVKDRVESAHCDGLGHITAHEGDDTGAHLGGGLVGEGEGQDAVGVDTVREHIGDAVGQHTRLPGAGARQYHYRSIYLLYSKLLLFIQI